MSIQLISKHRKYIMGMAALMIILCHNNLVVRFEPWETVVLFIRHFFQIGVDIFLLVSGVGGAFSYNKYNENLMKFYRARFGRIIPTYCVAIVAWCAFSFIVGWEKDFSFMWQYSIISFYIDGSGAEWYVSAIILLYLLFPLLYKILKKDSRIYSVSIIVIVLLSLTLSIVCKKSNFNEIFIVRIPVYMIGIMMGEKLRNGNNIRLETRKVYFFTGILFLMIVLNFAINDFNKWWLARMIFAPTAILISLILGWKAEAGKKLKSRKFITAYGAYTLENYLVNEKVLTVFACLVHRVVNRPVVTSLLVNLFGAVFTIVVAIVLNKAIGYMKNRVVVRRSF